MQELFRILEERREKGKDSMLVSVVEGSGSIPRTAGAYMVVGEEGYVYGTIGGGNLEHQGILAGQKLLEEKRSDVREYNLSNTQVAGLGMVCGGHVKILFYYLDATDKKNEKLQHVKIYLSNYLQEKYELKILNECVCIVDYQMDGSSTNMYRQYVRNPKGFAFWRKEQMKHSINTKQKIKACIHYVSSSLIAKNKHFIKESPEKFLTVLSIPLGFLLKIIVVKKSKASYMKVEGI